MHIGELMKTSLLVVSLLWLAACAGPSSSSGDPAALDNGLGVGATCTADADCAAGLECHHGTCQLDAEHADGGENHQGENEHRDGGDGDEHGADGGHHQGENEHGGDGGLENENENCGGDGGQHGEDEGDADGGHHGAEHGGDDDGGSGVACTTDSQCAATERCHHRFCDAD